MDIENLAIEALETLVCFSMKKSILSQQSQPSRIGKFTGFLIEHFDCYKKMIRLELLKVHHVSLIFSYHKQARRRGGSKGSNEPPLEVNNGGLKAQTTDFQLLANSGGMETNFECCSF